MRKATKKFDYKLEYHLIIAETIYLGSKCVKSRIIRSFWL